MVEIEERIFELFGEDRSGPEIVAQVVDEFGVEPEQGWRLARKVLRERGTPRQVRIREALDELHKISFV